MNVAQYLLSIGMTLPPKREGLSCPALGSRDPVMVRHAELDGYVPLKDAGGRTVPDTSRSAFSKPI